MKTIMETKGVCKYFGGLKAVDGVDMTVNRGDILGIIGPNGAGKTTFFNVITSIFPPTKGEVHCKGRDISKLTSNKIAALGIARTFQHIQLFRFMSVLENVKVGFHTGTRTGVFDAILHTRRYREDERVIAEKTMEILERVELTQYRDAMAGTLSYGLQRKVEIARTLALSPDLLLLDEPVAGMNPQETRAMMDFIKKLNADGVTIVVIEHDMKFVMNTCNRLIVLNFGKKICEGEPAYVKNDKAVNEAYFGKGLAARGEGGDHA
ncbi:MAG: ABC transporter ATP-binding protein [Oscillospiraceae bacterium]|jgi:branched-chain amino acid transport system ATP-binding protein|nr:ABC transporter ATP-binding protein [Oscillospiraceae bacterium]